MAPTTQVLYAPTVQRRKPNSGAAPWNVSPIGPSVVGSFDWYSVNNKDWPRQGVPVKENIGDAGSNWTLFKSYFEPSTYNVNLTCSLPFTYFGYRGPVIVHDKAQFSASDFLALDTGASSEINLMGLGTTAISRVLPTNPISDLPTAVAELFNEGLPMVPGADIAKRRRFTPKEISGNYLNGVFGIQPLLRDMQSFAEASKRAEALINDYASRAGKKIRRRYEFTPNEDTSEINFSPTSGPHLGGFYQNDIGGFLLPFYGGTAGTRTDVITRKKSTWFSGCFTYYLPHVGNDFSSRLLREEAEMRHLYGGISVDTAWNLLPYSWAADWMTNAGDVIHNVAAFARDGLVMPWGYVMESCELRSYRRVEGAVCGHFYDGTPLPPTISNTFGVVFKRRRKATPFGFGLDESGFTTRQKSILVALGINKFLK